MRENVTMEHILPGEIGEPASHPEITGDGDGANTGVASRVLLDVGWTLAHLSADRCWQVILSRGRNREHIPPHKRRRDWMAWLPGLRFQGVGITFAVGVLSFGAVGLEDLGDLE